VEFRLGARVPTSEPRGTGPALCAAPDQGGSVLLRNRLAVAATMLLACALSAPGQKKGGLTGAIFTTTFDGSFVNANLYDSKCAVYLDGGPGPNAPPNAAGLPDGDYYFQVTDPSGQTLLSADPVSNRRFQVSGGVIVAYTGTGGAPHPTGIDQDHGAIGAITIRLANLDCPADYLDTPNEGGVYKVWATRVADFVGDPSQVGNSCGGGCFHGFVPSKSKTDNFKVRPTEPTFCLTLAKEIDDGVSGYYAGVEWLIEVTDPLGVVTPAYMDENGQAQLCGLTAGGYTVTEEQQPDSYIVGLRVNGIEFPAELVQPTYSFVWNPGDPAPTIVFRNAFDDGPILN
jgi:hypothetical protein